MTLDDVFFLRVTTDDLERKYWAAAMPREDALQAVLDAVPEGWTVCLLFRARPDQVAALAINPGEVREVAYRSEGRALRGEHGLPTAVEAMLTHFDP